MMVSSFPSPPKNPLQSMTKSNPILKFRLCYIQEHEGIQLLLLVSGNPIPTFCSSAFISLLFTLWKWEGMVLRKATSMLVLSHLNRVFHNVGRQPTSWSPGSASMRQLWLALSWSGVKLVWHYFLPHARTMAVSQEDGRAGRLQGWLLRKGAT